MSALLGETFQEHCERLGIKTHEFNSPMLMGECVECGLRASWHKPAPVVETKPQQVPQAPTEGTMPHINDTPKFKVITFNEGKEFMSSSWTNQDQARETYNIVKSNTSMDVRVIMKIGVTEIDIIELVHFFAPFAKKTPA